MTERGQLTEQQVTVLLQPIRRSRVYHAQGQSHVAAFDVTAHLSRVFGFDGWDKEIAELALVHEHVQGEGKGARAWVTYRCVMRLTVRDPQGRVVKVVEEAATGSAQNMPGIGDAHDFAVKNAVSYALKRCAKDLGDQFGLSLYNKGATDALVGKTLVTRATEAEAAPAEEVDAHVPQIEAEGAEPGTVDPSTQQQRAEAAEAAEAGMTLAEVRADRNRDAGRRAAAEAREALREAAAKAGPTSDEHPLEAILERVDPSPVRARSTLLREAAGIVQELDLRIAVGWDDLREGEVLDELLRRHP
jgi:recombination DNA repair RAD52 pathway protein